jgi:hypothetical protein
MKAAIAAALQSARKVPASILPASLMVVMDICL